MDLEVKDIYDRLGEALVIASRNCEAGRIELTFHPIDNSFDLTLDGKLVMYAVMYALNEMHMYNSIVKRYNDIVNGVSR